MPGELRGTEAPVVLGAEKIHAELRMAIRETDNISFRLLGLVPLISGTALIGVGLGEHIPPAVVELLSLFAAAVTLGFFRWELRNVQVCSWLIKYAQWLENKSFAGTNLPETLRTRPSAPGLFRLPFGKTEAEKVIYFATILAWLFFPLAYGGTPKCPAHEGCSATCRLVYFAVAGLILIVTIASVFAHPHVKEAKEGEV